MSSTTALLLLLPLFSASPTILSPSPDLASCLHFSGVHNFSLDNDSPSHNRLISFSIQNLRLSNPYLPRPAAVILPHDLASLRASILCSRAASLTIRLRSGGHSYEGLSYLPTGGAAFVLLDLMNLHRVEVNAAAGTAWLQSGATLGQLYHAISTATANLPQQLAFSAGSCPTVGSGGHISGGGFGLLSRKYGLAADNVLDAGLVTPDGRFLDREAMGEDLFWAIRGGGGGTWGAVYSWTVQLQPVPNRVSALIINRAGSNMQVAQLIDAWQKAAPILPDEFYLSCFVGRSLPESDRAGMSATFKALYLGPASEARSILSDRLSFLEVQEQEIQEMSWIDSVVYFSGLKKGGSVDNLLDRELQPKTFFKIKSDYVRAHIEITHLVKMVDLLSMEPKAYLIMDPYGGAMASIQSDDLPFPHRAGNLYMIQHIIEWTYADDGGREGYIQWMQEWYEFMEPMVSGGPRAAYVNYLDLNLGHTVWMTNTEKGGNLVEDSREWGEKYYSKNYDKLVMVKTIVDPHNIFRNEQSIPPLTLSSQSIELNKSYDS